MASIYDLTTLKFTTTTTTPTTTTTTPTTTTTTPTTTTTTPTTTTTTPTTTTTTPTTTTTTPTTTTTTPTTTTTTPTTTTTTPTTTTTTPTTTTTTPTTTTTTPTTTTTTPTTTTTTPTTTTTTPTTTTTTPTTTTTTPTTTTTTPTTTTTTPTTTTTTPTTTTTTPTTTTTTPTTTTTTPTTTTTTPTTTTPTTTTTTPTTTTTTPTTTTTTPTTTTPTTTTTTPTTTTTTPTTTTTTPTTTTTTPTTTTTTPTTTTTTPTTTTTTPTKTTTLTTTTKSPFQKIRSICSSHDQCPHHSKCRPNACDGFVCLCDKGYIATRDSKSCIKARRIGETCSPITTRCISPFSSCDGTCSCYDPFVRTLDGRCKVKTAGFVGETCATMGCEYPAKCSREGICKCAPPFRDLTEEEFWVDPLITSQCQEENFSLWKCKGVLLEIPIDLQTTPTQPTTTTTTTTTQTTTTITTTRDVLTTTISTSTEAETEILTTETKMVTTTEKIITTPKTADVLETCINHQQCPVNARCRPNACEGFVCLCDEGYVKSRNGKACVKAVRIGEDCDVTKTACMSPFSGCSGVCQCYDGFAPSNDGRCKLRTASFAGERCGTLGCEHPAKCVNGFCRCSTPFRNMTSEEFWINPLETSQCHSQDFSLIKCKGQFINVPEDLASEWPILVHKGYQDNGYITTTTSNPTTFSAGPLTTPVQWFNSVNRDLNPTVENGTTQVYNTCLSHIYCPSNSMCRPNACDGFVCLCNKGYVATTGHIACLKAALIGEPCDGVNSKCLSPFATCTGTCKCHHPYVETSDGRCKLKSAAFLSETCGGRIGCEHPGVCEEGMCKCQYPYRKLNEDEFWVNPSTISQCKMGNFSLMKCDGKIIDVPEELVPEWADYLEAISKAEFTSSTPSPPITTPEAEESEKTTTVSRILLKSAILESCGNHEQCPDNARCHPNSCKGFVCLCNEGYLKSWDGSLCLKAVKMGDSCDALTAACMSPFSQCSGVCQCYDGFIASNDGRCKLKTTAFTGEECATLGCEHPAKCVDGNCRCVAPFRNMTKEEFWVNPLETSQCHEEVYSLIKCKGRYIEVPEDLRDEWPVLTNNSDENTNIVTSTTSPATSTVNAQSLTVPWYQLHGNHDNAYLNQHRGGNGTKEVYTTCSSHTHCPPNSKCRPNACEGFVCLCDKGYVATTGQATCIKASLIGQICDDISAKCLSPFATCVGSCQCFPPYHETKDGRCKLKTAAFLSEPCGGRIGCEHPGICESGICKCQSPYRKMNDDEFWVNPSKTSQCHKETFSLMKCKGIVIDVPDELLPEWQNFIESLSSVETTTTSSPDDTKLNVGTADQVKSSSNGRNVSLNSEVRTRLYSSCVTHDECPNNAKCRPKSCEGYVCICNMGYMSSGDQMSCQIASRIGEKCDDKNHRCLSPFSACAGSCRCYDKFVASKDGRCKLETTGFLGDRCGGRLGCEFPAKCSSDVCRCASPYRMKTVEEFWTDPSDTSQCLTETFSLRECNGKPITVPPGLKVDTFYERDFTDIFGNTTYNLPSSQNSKAPGDRINMKWDLFTTPKPRQFGSFILSPTNHTTENKTDANSGVKQEKNGQTGSSETQHVTFIGGGNKNVPTFIGKEELSLKLKVHLYENCIDHKQCPSNSICRPMSCDGYICLCRDGYLPSHDGKKCMKAVPVGEKCDDTTQCLSPFATCRGVCQCYDAFMTTQDGRCQVRTAGFIGDDCGGRIGCEYPAQCVEGTCKCEDPYRRLTRSEFWADPTRTLQCHHKDFSLDYCNGQPLQIPEELNNETSQLLPGEEDFFHYEPQGGFHKDIIYFKADLTPKTITLPDLIKDNRSLLNGSELKPQGSEPLGNDRDSLQNGLNLEPSYTQGNKHLHTNFDEHGKSNGVLNSFEDIAPSLLFTMRDISRDTHVMSAMNNDLASQIHSTVNDGNLNSLGGKKKGDLSVSDINPTTSGAGLSKGGQGGRHVDNRGPGSPDNENDKDRNKTNEIDPDKEKPNSVNENIVPNSILIPSVISAAILVNLVCLILIVTARRRRKRQNRNVETKAVQKPQYEQIKPEMFRIPRPLVATPSDDLESGYSSLPSQNKDKQEIIEIADTNFMFDNIRIPRPELKEANEPSDMPRVRKRSRTIQFTTTDSFNIENNWFDKIPRPLLSLSPRLLRTENWGTWPKVHTNPYNNAFSAPSDDNIYEEIGIDKNRETSV